MKYRELKKRPDARYLTYNDYWRVWKIVDGKAFFGHNNDGEWNDAEQGVDYNYLVVRGWFPITLELAKKHFPQRNF
jgi:hypothetical protein